MQAAKKVVIAALLLGLLLTGFNSQVGHVFAQESSRQIKVVVPYTEYEWWLLRWSDNKLMCQILIDHEGMPTINEAANSCGSEIANKWWSTPRCNPKRGITNCAGFYVFLIGSQPKEREVIVNLPMPTVWVSLEGCDPTPPENLCASMPALVLTGEEPLPNERIIDVQGLYDGQHFICQGDICKLPLSVTPLQGITVEFWADSSYGDSSEHYEAQVRVVDTGVSATPGGGGWYVDVVSDRWQGAPLASCARIWEAFPPVGSPPTWLSTPDHFELLASGEPYYYLAGRLIVQGLVDVSGCPGGGLLPNGYADACGLERARPIVEDWQNQFDSHIIEVADASGVPGQLMKNLFAQESQFWPGVYRVDAEFGLGQITDSGADAIFIWNSNFFHQFCPLILSSQACEDGYLALTPKDQAILRGALALQAKADCHDCPSGVDLSNTYFTVSLFANTLLANCAQVSRSIYTATNQMAGRVANYEDLWRFTIANYHAGPGCVSFAIHQAWQTTQTLTWDVVKTRFTAPCLDVVPYVDQITQ
jgi:hypothetical protein